MSARQLPVIGRFAAVKADGVICLANVIDKVAGTNRAKRVRLQTGLHAGEVRMAGQYDLIEFLDLPGLKPNKTLAALTVWAAATAE